MLHNQPTVALSLDDRVAIDPSVSDTEAFSQRVIAVCVAMWYLDYYIRFLSVDKFDDIASRRCTVETILPFLQHPVNFCEHFS